MLRKVRELLKPDCPPEEEEEVVRQWTKAYRRALAHPEHVQRVTFSNGHEMAVVVPRQPRPT